MKIFKLVSILVFVLLIGGFGYFAFTDIPVQQHEVSKEIPHERFRDN